MENYEKLNSEETEQNEVLVDIKPDEAPLEMPQEDTITAEQSVVVKTEQEIFDTVLHETPEETDQVMPEVEEVAAEQEDACSETAQPMDESSFEEEIPWQTNIQKKASPFEDSPYVFDPPVQVRVKKKTQKKQCKVWKKILCAVLSLAIVAGACIATGAVVNEYWEDRVDLLEDSFENRMQELEAKLKNVNTGISVSGSPNTSADGTLTPAQVYAKNAASVVLIYNEITAQYNGQTSVGTSSGSGFILSEDGYVVTNYHVVEGNGQLTVVMNDGKEYAANLIGCDETNDVALLKMEGEGFPAVTLGSSNDLIVGDQVVAIGNPLGELTSTLTVGYISAKERDVTTDGFAINMIQTDAAINSGNSGGPLFNMKGEVIGITTAKYSGTSSSGATIEGIGFAIPIDDVAGLLSDLATYGYVTGAYLGVSVSDMDPTAANYYGLPMGAYVQKVDAGYAAQRAGIQPKDIITKIGGIRVENVNDLTRALRNFKAGDLTVITICRGGREIELKITLDAKPIANQEQNTLPQQGQMPNGG